MIEDLDLPPILAEIAEVAGVVAALQVANAKGGTVAYFRAADNLAPGYWLVDAVGLDAARKIIERFGPGAIEIPLGPLAGNRNSLWTAIQKALKEGKSVATVARLVGVHARTVRRHKSGQFGTVPDDQQGRLF
ncbi:helix-turn-helix domain-containing protein [Telmatospirillum sp.]|uniref:helix-turn-helix domain-containing protein n=1 Tax=Telmatospirillum sp. TaxID=2079197 RepID=UPI002851F40E|nr:helix-turn-helix domain-containing protein [Telmatospirillum sp.]MDR3437157.1 helix-turn-helix domain-containing protein [Telmatospirillum sp.]